jgi:hypothetical protein
VVSAVGSADVLAPAAAVIAKTAEPITAVASVLGVAITRNVFGARVADTGALEGVGSGGKAASTDALSVAVDGVVAESPPAVVVLDCAVVVDDFTASIVGVAARAVLSVMEIVCLAPFPLVPLDAKGPPLSFAAAEVDAILGVDGLKMDGVAMEGVAAAESAGNSSSSSSAMGLAAGFDCDAISSESPDLSAKVLMVSLASDRAPPGSTGVAVCDLAGVAVRTIAP